MRSGAKMPSSGFLSNLRNLVLPPRPDPAASRVIAEMRLLICASVAILAFSIIGFRIFNLSDAGARERIANHFKTSHIERGQILDRKGRLLATNLPITVLHADPSEIMDVTDAASKLAPLISRHDVASLKKILSKKTRYVELDRKLTPARHAEILGLGIPGVYFAESTLRVYPRAESAAHILGQVDPENNGIAGIEKSQDAHLATGRDIHLSLDVGLQAIMRAEIYKQINEFEAIGGAGVLLDTRNGEILAMTSLPDYNPNHFAKAGDDARFNRATKGLYEMGSTFKVLNTAIALETGVATPRTEFEVMKPLRVSRFTINDYHPSKKPLNVAEIMVHSSNIGSALMAEEFGATIQKEYMKRLGLLDRLPLELPEIAKPLSPKYWKRAATLTVSYGHGISISPTHLASAVSTASSNGLRIAPTLLKRKVGEELVKTRVFSEQTAHAVRSMMRLVVSHKKGTGKKARAPGYMVGGKTGTAEKIQATGGYNAKANLATFVATFPVHDPRYVIVIMVDEPKGQKQSHGFATGGWVAAPAVRRIVEQISPILGVHPVDEESPLIRQKLMLDFNIGNQEATLASF